MAKAIKWSHLGLSVLPDVNHFHLYGIQVIYNLLVLVDKVTSNLTESNS